MTLKELWDIQYPSEDYIPQVFLLFYVIKKEDGLSMERYSVSRESADKTIAKIESLPEFNRWCTEYDLKGALKILMRWGYNLRKG